MAVCTACGTSYGPNVRICVHDGTPLNADARSDKYLGTLLEGKYRIDARIGAGGMGSVYRGEHVMLGKTVAVKVINHHLVTSDEVVVRFQREARAVASLDHPNIVTVYDLGQLPDGTLYIAMEYIDGPTLKSRLRTGGPLNPGDAASLLTQVASALSFAHRKQIVHRDLKSENLMLASDDEGRTLVKLVDFGIAKTFDESTQLTVAGYMMGTPHYMAPEQAAGATVDHRADLYSLGVILYEALTGQVPFGDATLSSVLVRLATEIPSPPSVRYTEGRIPPALDAVVMRCLEKDPARRFQSADDFAAALERAAGEPDARTLRLPTPPTPAATLVRAVPTPAFGSTAARHQVEADLQVGLVSPAVTAHGSRLITRAALGVLVIAAVAGAAVITLKLRGDSSEPSPSLATTRPPETSQPTTSIDRAVANSRDRASARLEDAPPATEARQPTAPRPNSRVEPQRGPVDAGPTAPKVVAAPTPGATVTQTTPVAPVRTETPSLDGGSTTAPPVQSARKGPSVSIACEGPSDVCDVIRAELVRAMQTQALPVVGTAATADVAVTANVTLVSAVPSMQSGTPIMTRTYSVELVGSSHRTALAMPAPHIFGFDPLFSRAKLQQGAQFVAAGAAEAVLSFADRQ
jgi:eukaryotic-like serine/threonine-protein kinase